VDDVTAWCLLAVVVSVATHTGWGALITIGLTVAYVGIALLVNMAWPLLTLPAVLIALRLFVIAREERHLRQAFPEAYAAYCARVRRWL